MIDMTLSATYSSPKIPPVALTKFTMGASEQYARVEQKTLEAFGQTHFRRSVMILSSNLADYFVPNWDGEGAKPVSFIAIMNCAAFLTKSAGKIPMPGDIQIDPDGWISLEWYVDQSNLLEISFGPSDVATYSALTGNRGHCGEIDVLDKEISRPLSALFEELDDINPAPSHAG